MERVVIPPGVRVSRGQYATAVLGRQVIPTAPRASARRQDFAGAHFLSSRNTRLRGLRFEDVGELSSLHQDPAVRRTLLEPAPTAFLDIAGLVIRANRVYIEQPGLGLWHASDQEGRFLGVLSLLPAPGAGVVELGMRLSPAHATREAVGDGIKALCEHAFGTLGLLTLSAQAHVDDDNAAQWLLACGFAGLGESLRHGPCARAFALEGAAWQHGTIHGFNDDLPPGK